MTEVKTRDRATVIDEAFSSLQRWSIRVICISVAAYILGWIVGKLWVILLPVSLALIIAAVLEPTASWLRKKGWPSALATAVVVLTFIAALVGTIAVLTPQLAGQAPVIARGASEGLQQVRDWLTGDPLNLSEGQITRAIEAVQQKLQESAAAISSGVFSTLSAATSAVVTFVVVLMLTFYFVKDGYKFAPWAATLGGKRAGIHAREILHRSWRTLGGFIRTQTIVALIDAILIGVGLMILDVELAIPLAVITFLTAYIPIVGAFLSGAITVLITLVSNGPTDALIALLIVLVVQQVEGNILSPMLQGQSLNLHPAVVLLGVTAGGSLFGIVGALLAVPVIATSAEIMRYVNECIDEEVDDDAPDEDSRAAEALKES